jgi:DNA methyltransferase 1-associated protein 1
VEAAGIKFPDFKGSGVSLRSQRMKLPASVGQKRTKAIEQLLQELSIGIVAKYFCQNKMKHE